MLQLQGSGISRRVTRLEKHKVCVRRNSHPWCNFSASSLKARTLSEGKHLVPPKPTLPRVKFPLLLIYGPWILCELDKAAVSSDTLTLMFLYGCWRVVEGEVGFQSCLSVHKVGNKEENNPAARNPGINWRKFQVWLWKAQEVSVSGCC